MRPVAGGLAPNNKRLQIEKVEAIINIYVINFEKE